MPKIDAVSGQATAQDKFSEHIGIRIPNFKLIILERASLIIFQALASLKYFFGHLFSLQRKNQNVDDDVDLRGQRDLEGPRPEPHLRLGQDSE